MGFTLYAYLFKIKSICKSEIVMESDDNVWNDKDTDDFLRYLKFEYFMVNYTFVKAVSEIMIGFVQRDDMKIFSPKFEANEFVPVGVIFTLLLLNSVIIFINITSMLTKADTHISIEQSDADLYTRTKTNRVWWWFKGLTWLGCMISVITLYFVYD